MNGPFQVAQANVATPTSGKPPARIVKVTKPFGEQSVVVPLSYDGSVKADLSSIAGENITLVHIGEKLIILFDNKSTVTLEPFFDSNGAPLNGITVEVSPGRDLTGTEFAALFPVTEDRSILPAAGDGNGPGAQASGAYFTSVGVDPLAAPNPLDLLPQEDLPNFTINTILRQNDFINGIPSALPNGVVALDEDEIPGVFGNPGGPGDINAPHTFSGTLGHDFGLDGAGSISFAAMNGVQQVINGVTVTFTWNDATHTLTANDGSGDVFQVVITNPATGDYTVTLLSPLHHHTDALADNTEASDNFNLTYTVTDSNGTTANGTLTLEINDDTPVAHDSAPIDTVVVIGEGEGQEGGQEVVTQYATIDDDGQTNGNSGDNTNGDDAGDATSVSGKLDIAPGADGLKAVAFTGLDGQPHVTVTADDGSHPALQVIFVNPQTGEGTPENVTLVWHADGNGGGTLIGISDHFSENNPAFTLKVDSQGNYTFDVHAPFAQPLTNDGSEGSTQIGWEDNIHVQFTYTATDGDGDKASATLTFNIDDDTPTVVVTTDGRGGEGQEGQPLLVTLDESIGGDRGANGAPNGTNDDTGNTHPDPTGTNPIGKMATEIGDGESPGGLQSLFNVFKSPGADGVKSITYSYTFNLTGAGHGGEGEGQNTGVATTLKATGYADGTIYLFQEDATHIVGRVGGENGDIAIRITLTDANDLSGGQLVVEQYLAIDHGKDGNNFDSTQLLELVGERASLGVTLTTTITDGDGDQATGSATYTLADGHSSTIGFQDDGPAPLAISAANGAANGLFFDGFTPNNDQWGTGSGVNTSGTAGAWHISASSHQGASNVQLERVGDGYRGADSPTDSVMVDMEATPGNLKLTQDIANLNPGEVYHLTFEIGAAADAAAGSAKLAVFWNGVQVGEYTPNSGVMQTISIDVTAGSGNNQLTFEEIGTAGDNTGTFLANVKLADTIIIDETAGNDPGSNDTDSAAVVALFASVANTGTDPNMDHPQYAQGTHPVIVLGTPNYGTDGPAATNPIQIGLTVSSAGVDSGLTTTAGQHIYLFVENGLIVGRFDADGDANHTPETAAFALSIDQNGNLSIVQYVSLHQPDTNSHDEGVYLNSGTVLATATLTDGDGDHTTSSADISSAVRFEDDGPSIDPAQNSSLRDWTLDEDVLSAGNDAYDNPADTNDYTVLSDKPLGVNWGADGAKALTFVATDSHTPTITVTDQNGASVAHALTSGGVALTYEITTNPDGGQTLIAYKGDDHSKVIFTLTLDPHGDPSGAFSFELKGPLDHPDGGGENTLNLNFGFTATDGDDDTVSSSITIRITDDIPVANVGDATTVDEADLLSGTSTDLLKLTAAGDLHIQWGADNNNSGSANRSVSFTSTTVLAVDSNGHDAGALTSGGQPLHYAQIGNVLYAYTTSLINPVFLVTLNDSGTGGYTFTLLGNLDHPAGTDALKLTFGYTATDADGDKSSNTFTVTVADDGPIAHTGDAKSVSEANLSDGTVHDTSHLTASGHLHIEWGADQANPTSGAGSHDRSVGFTNTNVTVTASDGSPVSHLTSNGDAVKYMISNGELIGYTGNSNHPHEVFRVSLSDSNDGTYTFTLKDTLDDPQGSNGLTFTFNYTATDSDGDKSNNGTFAVTVKDDAPIAGIGDAKTVDEADLLSGTSTDLLKLTVGGDLHIQWGADNHNSGAANRSVSFTSTTVVAIDNNGHDAGALTSDGQPLHYAQIGNVLYAYTTSLINPVFLVTLNDSGTGGYTFTLLGNLDHPAGADALKLTFGYTATDADGDSNSSTFAVTVKDDGPSITVTATGESNVELTTHDADTIGNASDHAVSTANFSGVFNTTTSYGADGAGSTNLSYKLAITGAPGANGRVDSGLDSHGQTIYLYSDGHGGIVGSTSSDGTGIDANKVFTLTVDNNGVVTLTQYSQIDHPIGQDPSASGAPFDDQYAVLGNNLISLTRDGSITDGDGDTATSSATIDLGGNIRFADDGPTASAETRTLAEHTAITGKLDFEAGADGASVTHIGNVKLTFGNDGYSQTIDIGAGTIKVKADGSYVFTADDSVNNTNGAVPVHTTFTVTDSDGDTSTANIDISVTDANVPTGGTSKATVDDDGLTGGNPNSTDGDLNANIGDAPGDTSEATFTGKLAGSMGGDGPGAFSFGNVSQAHIGQEDVVFTWSGNVLTATVSGGARDGLALFTVALNPVTGDYQVTLLHNILHAQANNAENGDVSVVLPYTITDSDGSQATGNLQITFDDDAPSAVNYTGGHFAEGGAQHDIGNAVTLLQINPGADGLASVTFSAGSLGGTVTIDSSGHLIYTTPNHINSATTVTETFTYTVTDGDGDSVTKQITFGVDDTGVVSVSASNAVVDEDDISTIGNNDSAAGDNATSASGHISYTLGADAVKSVELSVATTGMTKLDGTAVHTTWDAATHTLIGYGTSINDVVFKIVVTDVNNTGANYDVTLLQPVQHPGHTDPSNPAATSYEDNKDFTVTVTVTDADGSQNTGSFTVSIDDDSPVILSPEAGTTSEANIAGGTATAHGSLGIHFGADGAAAPAAPASSGTPHTINFDDAHNGTLPGGNYTHDGFNFHTDQGIANVTDHAGQMYGTLITVWNNGNAPFTITQMDLGLFGTSNSTLADNVRLIGVDTHGNNIVVIFNVGALIGLGGAATTFHAAGTALDGVSLVSLQIEPVLGWQGNVQFNGSVVVDNVVLNSGSAPLTHGAVSFTDLTTAINNITIVDSDHHAVAPAALTSHGEAIHYALLDSVTLVGYTGDTAPTAINGANVVFSVVLSQDANHPNGAYDFTLHQPLDDLPSGVTDLNFTFNFTAKDGDGDAVNGQFTVDVKDDVPTIVQSAAVSGAVDEDALTGASVGNSDNHRPGETTGTGLATVSGQANSLNALVHFGADGPGVIQFASEAAAKSWIVGLNLWSQGHKIDDVTISGHTLTAHSDDGRSVFSLQVNDNGSWTFTLIDQIDHPLTDDPATTQTHEKAFEDTIAIDLSGLLVATDGDGDPTSLAGANFQVTVRDDIPYFDAVAPVTVTHVGELVTGTSGFHVGADEPGHLSVTAPAIDGVTVTTTTDEHGVITVTGTFSDTGKVYYVLSVNQDGTYQFEIDNLPTAAHPLAAVSLGGGSGPVHSKDFGAFTVTANGSHNINTSGQGIGIDNGNSNSNEGMTIAFDHQMTVVNLDVKHMGSADVTVHWKASNSTDPDPSHFETGTATVHADGTVTIDIAQHDGGAVNISSFDTLVIMTTAPGNNGSVKFTSLGGTEIVDAGQQTSFDFGVIGTDRDGDAASGAIHINYDPDLQPSVTAASISVDEKGLPPHGAGLPAGSGEIADGIPDNNSDNSERNSGTIAIEPGDGPSVVTINGTTVLAAGQDIAGTYGTLHINSVTSTSISYTYTLTKNASDDAAHDDFAIKVTDSDGDHATTTLSVSIIDDVPTIAIIATGESNIQLVTQDADTIGAASDVAVSNANFGGVFQVTSAYGADGAGSTSVSYQLAVTATPVNGHVDSGLDSQGATIYLYNVNGTIVGSTSETANGINDGNKIFALSVDSNGVVTLTQYAEIDHPAASDPSGTGAPFDDQFAVLGDNLVSLTRNGSITDGDGDTSISSASVDLGGNIRFQDDGPSITAAADAVSVDEGNLPSDRNPTNIPGSIVGIAQSGFGSLHINWGADNSDAKHLAFAKDTNGNVIGPDLKSDGVKLLYEIHFPGDSPGNEQIVAYKENDPNHTPVFAITLYESGNGGYAYVQFQNIDHTADGADTSQFSLNVIAYDADGDSVQQTLTINVKDDVPVGHDDTNSVTEGQGHSTTGNVFAGGSAGDVADVVGADGPATGGAVTGAYFGSEANAGSATITTVTSGGVLIHGTYGDLLLHSDGSYTYTLKTASIPADVTSETFTYRISDGDGDADFAQLQISLNQDTNVPNVTGDTQTVYEDGLADGLQHGPDSETKTGSFTVDAHGEAFTLKIDGTDVTSAALVNAASSPIQIATDHGTLTITGYNAATGVVDYSYTLGGPLTHTGQGEVNPLTDTISLSVTDATGDSDATPGQIVISIVDDVPVINIVDPASTTVDEGTTLNGTWSLAPGADGVTQIEVTAGGTTKILSLASGSNTQSFSVDGGTLTVDADGQWHFAAGQVTTDKDVTFTLKAIDGDGDTSSDSQTITVHDVNKPLEVQAVALGVVEEEHGLPGGIDDTNTGQSDLDQDTAGHLNETTNVLTGSFTDAAHNPVTGGQEGNLSFALASLPADRAVETGSGDPLTSGGKQVYFAINGGNLIGYTNSDGGSGSYGSGDTKVFTFTLQSNGTYSFTLNAPVDHPNGNGENTLDINLNGRVTVTDSAGPGTDTKPVDVSVKVIDDAPVAHEGAATATEGAKPTVNAVFVLDLSLSMGSSSGDPTGSGDNIHTRLELMQAAVQNFLNSSTVTFNQITIYTFSNGAQYVGQYTIGENNYIQNAITKVNSFDQGDLQPATQYDSAANLVGGTGAGGYQNLSHPSADTTNIYFLSDGDPTSQNTLSTSEQNAWNSFLATQHIGQVYAIGFSGVADTTYLEQIASRDTDVAKAVTDPNELSSTLSGALPSGVEGNVLDDTGHGAGGFGADGGHVQSISVDGHTYSYTSGGATHVDVTTALGGKLTFYFVDDGAHHAGDYSYTAPANVNGDQQEDIHYVLVDRDGDTAGSDLVITVKDIPNHAPEITAPNNGADPTTISVAENTTAVTDVNATDADAGNTLTYSIVQTPGTDYAKFHIDSSTGVLTFNSAPNYEAPNDVGGTAGDNIYVVTVQVSDGHGGVDTQTINVKVTDVNEAPVGGADIVLSNYGGSAYSIPEWALLSNDSDPEGGSIDIASGNGGIQSQSGLNSVTHTNGSGTNGSVNIDDNGNGGTGSFVYVLSDGSTTSTANVNVTNQNGGNLTGTAANEILIGDSDGDTFDGKGGVDIILAGGGDDTIVADQADRLIDGGTGTDTLRVDGAFTSTSDAQIVNVEKVTISSSVGVMLDLLNQTEGFTITGGSGADHISGGSGNDTITGGGGADVISGGGGDDIITYANVLGSTLDGGSNTSAGDTLVITGSTVPTINLGNAVDQTSGDNTTVTGFENIDASGATGSVNITGSSGANVISVGTGGGTINAGAGADIVSIAAGSTTGKTWTVDLGANDGAQDKIVFAHNTVSPDHNTVVTVSNFETAHDKIAVLLNGTDVAGGGYQTITSASGNGATVTVGVGGIVELVNSAWTGTLTDDSDNGTIEGFIKSATNTFNGGTGTYTFIVYSGTGASANAGIYSVTITDSTNPSESGMTVEHIMTLNGVGYGNLSSSNFAGAADPIVLDLDHNGFGFTSQANGVQFDINHDGSQDQVAWTNGQDGLLAVDINGNGKIDNGSELFTPNFAGGHFADGLAALASLDANHDGVIDSKDQAFAELSVWQDTNHDGVTDAGELHSLSSLGITSVNLNATPGTGAIDGQSVAANGTFTYADGSKGSFVEVDLDASLGSGDHDGHTQTGINGVADTFALPASVVGHADTIVNFNGADGDKLDLSALLDHVFAQSSDVDKFVHLEQSGGNVVVQVDATGQGNFAGGSHDVAVLAGGVSHGDIINATFAGAEHQLHLTA